MGQFRRARRGDIALTYSRMIGHAGELFGRVDAPLNVFVKGFQAAYRFDQPVVVTAKN
jgi:hypothetical protein